MSRIRGKAQPKGCQSAAVFIGIDAFKGWLDVFLHPDGGGSASQMTQRGSSSFESNAWNFPLSWS